ncbi:uncharacterized protein LOC102782081 isoform X1 [Neolamprologus brichardi]|nr:uncharacterized protein LOC102782081 isoform X1 [Neolamprologus brichardi]
MRRIRPDCPILLPLNDSESLKFIHDMVKLFNINIAKKHYYILQDVARITAGKYMHENYAEFVLVESRCPVGSKIPIEECTPLCPDRADYAYCQGFEGFECYINDPKNTTALGPGEEEPVCGHHERSQPHDHEHGHGSPPTGGKGKGSIHPLRRFHPCHGFLFNPDPALHPICPWPLPHRTQNESRIS